MGYRRHCLSAQFGLSKPSNFSGDFDRLTQKLYHLGQAKSHICVLLPIYFLISIDIFLYFSIGNWNHDGISLLLRCRDDRSCHGHHLNSVSKKKKKGLSQGHVLPGTVSKLSVGMPPISQSRLLQADHVKV